MEVHFLASDSSLALDSGWALAAMPFDLPAQLEVEGWAALERIDSFEAFAPAAVAYWPVADRPSSAEA